MKGSAAPSADCRLDTYALQAEAKKLEMTKLEAVAEGMLKCELPLKDGRI